MTVAIAVIDGAALSAPASAGGSEAQFDQLANCESGGRWNINTGNGYYGGLQFNLATWRSLGFGGYPHEASRETQIAAGQKLQSQRGWGPWPGCSRKLGLSGDGGVSTAPEPRLEAVASRSRRVAAPAPAPAPAHTHAKPAAAKKAHTHSPAKPAAAVKKAHTHAAPKPAKKVHRH